MSHFEKVSFEQWKADCGIKGLLDKELREWYEAIRLPRQATSSSAGTDFFMPFNLNFEAGSTFRIRCDRRDPSLSERSLAAA